MNTKQITFFSFVCTVTNNTPTLEAAHFTDGQLKATGVNYTLTDHLGSVRALVDANGTLLKQDDYYPFDSRHVNASYVSSDNRYTFSGKESQDLLDLNTYDFGARMYDSEIGRWMLLDLMLEKYYPFSAYVYCVGIPILYIDPDGESPTVYEAALMAKNIYGDRVALEGGWILARIDEFSASGYRGGLAAANVLATGRNAITFNPAALSYKTKKNLGLPEKAKGSIFNVIVEGELVDYLQSRINMKPEGAKYLLKAHYLFIKSSVNTYLRYKNHSIDTIIKKLEKEK